MTATHADEPIMIDSSGPVAGIVKDGDSFYDFQYQPYNDHICVSWQDFYDSQSGMGRL